MPLGIIFKIYTIMTDEQKFAAIIDRTKIEKLDMEPEYISIMVIISYLEKMADLKIVECGFKMTPTGRSVAAICEEFDWKPSNSDIFNFVTDMVDEADKSAFAYIIIKYRDDREGLLTAISTFKSENPVTENPPEENI